MFVRDFVIIDHPLDYVWARVLGSTESVDAFLDGLVRRGDARAS